MIVESMDLGDSPTVTGKHLLRSSGHRHSAVEEYSSNQCSHYTHSVTDHKDNVLRQKSVTGDEVDNNVDFYQQKNAVFIICPCSVLWAMGGRGQESGMYR